MQNHKTTILHMIETTGPGGAETVVLQLIGRLDPNEFDSTVVLSGRGWLYDNMMKTGITPEIVPSGGAFDWRFLRQIVRLIRRRKIDLIHSHLPDTGFYACLAGMITGVPVLVTIHGMVGAWSDRGFRSRLKMGLIRRRAARVAAVSDQDRKSVV